MTTLTEFWADRARDAESALLAERNQRAREREQRYIDDQWNNHGRRFYRDGARLVERIEGRMVPVVVPEDFE